MRRARTSARNVATLANAREPGEGEGGGEGGGLDVPFERPRASFNELSRASSVLSGAILEGVGSGRGPRDAEKLRARGESSGLDVASAASGRTIARTRAVRVWYPPRLLPSSHVSQMTDTTCVTTKFRERNVGRVQELVRPFVPDENAHLLIDRRRVSIGRLRIGRGVSTRDDRQRSR
jgi:hypothetical protein